MEKLMKLLILTLIIFSCDNKNNYNFIEYNSKINYDTINKIEFNRGTIKMNRYHLLTNCQLINENNAPKWIKDLSSPDFKCSKYIFKPSILDIKTPYVLFKKQKDSIFFIIKNNDTLQFKIVEF
jgi:hypothetical protein